MRLKELMQAMVVHLSLIFFPSSCGMKDLPFKLALFFTRHRYFGPMTILHFGNLLFLLLEKNFLNFY